MNTNINKHLSVDERRTIENLLNCNYNFTNISKVLKKHRTTIAREVYSHRIMKEPTFFNRGYSECIHYWECKEKKKYSCYKKCNDYKEKLCAKVENPPYVCNGCEKKSSCKKRRFFYDYAIAQNDYNELLVDSRNTIHFTKSQLNEINRILKPLIVDQHQSINQVFINHPELLNMSKTTFYKLVDSGLINIRNIDLERKVKLKYKKIKRETVKKEPEIKEGRTYKDFEKYISMHPEASIVEMDTVIGTSGGKGGKCFLTILFRKSKLMLIYLMNYKNTKCVTEVFDNIKTTLGIDNFRGLFEVILTDNGSEFFEPTSIEINANTGEKIANIFYCDSNCAWQKGMLERNHEYIRYILPKGTSFANLSQEDCNILASHINNVPRESLNKKTPYEIFSFLESKEILNDLSITHIEPDKVNLTTDIFKK